MDFGIEAKVAWQPVDELSSKPDGIWRNEFKKTVKQWGEAWKASGKLLPEEADNRVAALFIVPYLKGRVFDISALVSEVRNLQGVEACAHYFADSQSLYEGAGRRFFPGVILALRHRKRAIKTSPATAVRRPMSQ